MSKDFKINFSIYYEDFDMFSKIEGEFYIKYPDLKNKNIIFIANEEEINRTSTMKENNIKNGDFIFIKYIE